MQVRAHCPAIAVAWLLLLKLRRTRAGILWFNPTKQFEGKRASLSTYECMAKPQRPVWFRRTGDGEERVWVERLGSR